MKKLLLSLFVLAIAFASTAQNVAKKADDVIKFTEVRYNFGKIKQGVPVIHDFQFSNIGVEPLIIETASASCGCTTPTWPKQPVMKSKADILKAGFNAAAPGPFEKTIFVKIKGIDSLYELKNSVEEISAFECDKTKK